jgi:hypothetical protein
MALLLNAMIIGCCGPLLNKYLSTLLVADQCRFQFLSVEWHASVFSLTIRKRL